VEVDSQKTTDAQDDVIRLECLRHRNVVQRRSASRVLSRHRGQQPASVIAINVPASTRYIPLTPDRELQEEGAPIAWFLPRLAFQYLIDRLYRTRAPDRVKSGIALQMFQVFRPRRRPS